MPKEIAKGLVVETIGDILDRKSEEKSMTEESPLAKLREPFPHNQISKLPKESRKQIDERKADNSKIVFNCSVCGGIHHKNAVHLDYVGHAAATDRLLDTDLEWTWEPLAIDQRGLPAFDDNGGLWIRLTVCGVSRLGYGSADGKTGGDAKKEIIGDAIRNAGMRFGMALDLWHKGDLHVHADDDGADAPETSRDTSKGISAAQCAELRRLLKEADSSEDAFVEWLRCGTLPELKPDRFMKAKKALEDRIAATIKEKQTGAVDGAEIPY